MKIRGHIVVTLAVSSIIYFVYNSFSAFVSSLVGGLMIDIDHLIDYYRHEGINFKIKRFFKWCYGNEWKELVIFFHSIELIFVLWIIISIFKLGIFWIGFAAGFSQHVVLDVLFNNKRINLFSYFFIYRYYNGFKREYIMR